MLTAPSAPPMTAPTRALGASQHTPALDLPARFVATGLGWLALVALLLPESLGTLARGFYQSTTLALVHLFALGFLGHIILGASYQLVPVVVGAPLRWPTLGRLSWWLLTPGVGALVLGLWRGVPLLLAVGGTLLLVALLLFAAVISVTLARAPRRDVVAAHIATATGALVLAASFGLLLAGSKGGALSLRGFHFQLLTAHIVLMVVGWVSLMIVGVATRLIPMFTLTEDLVRPRLALAHLGLLAGGSAALTMAWGLPDPLG